MQVLMFNKYIYVTWGTWRPKSLVTPRPLLNCLFKYAEENKSKLRVTGPLSHSWSANSLYTIAQ